MNNVFNSSYGDGQEVPREGHDQPDESTCKSKMSKYGVPILSLWGILGILLSLTGVWWSATVNTVEGIVIEVVITLKSVQMRVLNGIGVTDPNSLSAWVAFLDIVRHRLQSTNLGSIATDICSTRSSFASRVCNMAHAVKDRFAIFPLCLSVLLCLNLGTVALCVAVHFQMLSRESGQRNLFISQLMVFITASLTMYWFITGMEPVDTWIADMLRVYARNAGAALSFSVNYGERQFVFSGVLITAPVSALFLNLFTSAFIICLVLRSLARSFSALCVHERNMDVLLKRNVLRNGLENLKKLREDHDPNYRYI